MHGTRAALQPGGRLCVDFGEVPRKTSMRAIPGAAKADVGVAEHRRATAVGHPQAHLGVKLTILPAKRVPPLTSGLHARRCAEAPVVIK
jgi:hypothetical protein